MNAGAPGRSRYVRRPAVMDRFVACSTRYPVFGPARHVSEGSAPLVRSEVGVDGRRYATWIARSSRTREPRTAARRK